MAGNYGDDNQFENKAVKFVLTLLKLCVIWGHIENELRNNYNKNRRFSSVMPGYSTCGTDVFQSLMTGLYWLIVYVQCFQLASEEASQKTVVA